MRVVWPVWELSSKKKGEIHCFSILTSPMQESLVRRPDLSKWSAGLAYSQRHGCIAHLQEGKSCIWTVQSNPRAPTVMVAMAMHDTS